MTNEVDVKSCLYGVYFVLFINREYKMKVEFISVGQIQGTQCESLNPAVNSQPQKKNIQPKTSGGRKQKLASKAKQLFNCPLCKSSFSTKKSYNIHKKSHSNDGTYNCATCQQSFDDIDKLSTHMRRHDGKADESEKYQCNICQTRFNDLNDLKSHVGLHFDLETRYKCSICENSFFNIDHQLKHTKIVHGDALNVTFNCYICGGLLHSIDEFVEHDLQHKNESLKCSECSETFSSLASLNLHKKSHSIPRTQSYVCQKCNLRFSRSEDLHNHVRVHDGKSIYCCALCERMFAHSKNFTNHIHKIHKSCFTADELHLIDFVIEAEVASQMDQYKLRKVLQDENSPVDGDVFNLNVRQLVTKHMTRDTPSLPSSFIEPPIGIPKNVTRRLTELFRKYKCPLCDLTFVKAKTLEIHCKRNHFGKYTLDELKSIQRTADRNTSQSFPRAILNGRLTIAQKHECFACSMMYESREELIDHLKKDHNGDLPYKCAECSNSFQTSNALADHVLNHPDKRHECKFCGLTFMNLYSLGKHTKRHEGPNAETCSICNIPYNEKKDLVKHMRIHADGKPHKCLYCDKRFAQSCDRQKHMRIHTGCSTGNTTTKTTALGEKLLFDQFSKRKQIVNVLMFVKFVEKHSLTLRALKNTISSIPANERFNAPPAVKVFNIPATWLFTIAHIREN
ncbi:Zinc finger protein, partial [Pseudolycoriella hygida]